MIESLKAYKLKFLALDRAVQISIICALLATICAICFDFRKNDSLSTDNSGADASSSSLDTFIPDGFSLVPIEILNSSGMDSILGRYGTADLYRDGQKEPFMRNVRLIRGIEVGGPWAALVPTPFAENLLSVGGRFYVAVKSSKIATTEFKKTMMKPKRKIIYEGE